jgi:replicative DNA helicase
MDDCLQTVLQDWDDRLNGKKVEGYTTPFDNMNDMLAPKMIPKGSLFVIGGLPKMGKTKFISSFINHHALKYKEQVVIYSLEMKSAQMAERALCDAGRFDSNLFYQKENDKASRKITEGVAMLTGKNMHINDSPGITIDQIEMECRQLANQSKVGLISVDYLTLMTAPKADRNDLAFGTITKRLKNLAKELDCYVLLATQLSREVTKRPNKRPYPQDSRDTGQIEQDCDFWVGIHKQSVFEPDNYEHKNVCEAIVRYNRHGSTGTVYLDDKGPYLEGLKDKPAGYGEQPQEQEPPRRKSLFNSIGN